MLSKDWKKQIRRLKEWGSNHPFFIRLNEFVSSNVNKWKPPGSENVIGLDINSEKIKLLKINKKRNSYEVEYFAIADLPKGTIAKDKIKDSSAIADAIRKMFDSLAISAKDVALAIPRSMAIIKQTGIDARLNSDEVESRAWIEAQRQFPELVGDIFLDFTVTGVMPDDPNQKELLLVACRKEHVKPYLELASEAGINAKILDIDSYALERALQLVLSESNKSKVLALLNLNVNLSTLIVVQNGRLIYAHDQSFDGRRLESGTKKYLAEKGFQSVSDPQVLLADEGYCNILKENLISHIRHTVHFFYSSRPNIAIEKILFSGDCALIQGVAPFIQREIGIESAVVDLASQLELASNVDADLFIRNAPALMLCCGLALSGDEEQTL